MVSLLWPSAPSSTTSSLGFLCRLIVSASTPSRSSSRVRLCFPASEISGLHCWSTDLGNLFAALSENFLWVLLFSLKRSWCASCSLFFVFICRRHCSRICFPTTSKSTVCVLFGPSTHRALRDMGINCERMGTFGNWKVHYSRSLSRATLVNYIRLYSAPHLATF